MQIKNPGTKSACFDVQMCRYANVQIMFANSKTRLSYEKSHYTTWVVFLFLINTYKTTIQAINMPPIRKPE
jgi:hypothetical protein